MYIRHKICPLFSYKRLLVFPSFLALTIFTVLYSTFLQKSVLYIKSPFFESDSGKKIQ